MKISQSPRYFLLKELYMCVRVYIQCISYYIYEVMIYGDLVEVVNKKESGIVNGFSWSIHTLTRILCLLTIPLTPFIIIG